MIGKRSFASSESETFQYSVSIWNAPVNNDAASGFGQGRIGIETELVAANVNPT
jgi:hypothetical protein